MRVFSLYKISPLLLLFILTCNHEAAPPEHNNGESDSTSNQYGTPFGNMPATGDIVMYEINLRAFSASGDLQGVINRLDALDSLGVNVIWLMPIHPIGEIKSVNSPYSVKDYKAVSPEYGTLQDLRKLTDEAHAMDMAVIMDWVANHTAWDNEWIQNKSWYSQDESGNIIHPPGTNWEDVADLDYSNAEMRTSMIDAMKYWVVEANVDGFRCDYADGVPYDFWKQAFDSLNAVPGRDYIFLAEGGREDHFDAGFDLNYAWDFYGTLKAVWGGQSANNLFTMHKYEYNKVPEGRHKLRFTTNHDESAWDRTPMVLFNGQEGALAASAVTIFLGGVPLLYTGQEVGTVNNIPFFSNAPIDWDNNPDMLQEYKEIMRCYCESEAAKQGNITYFINQDVVCFKKTTESENLLVMVNTRNNPVEFNLPEDLKNSQWTDAISSQTVVLESSVQFVNYQYFILEQ